MYLNRQNGLLQLSVSTMVLPLPSDRCLALCRRSMSIVVCVAMTMSMSAATDRYMRVAMSVMLSADGVALGASASTVRAGSSTTRLMSVGPSAWRMCTKGAARAVSMAVMASMRLSLWNVSLPMSGIRQA